MQNFDLQDLDGEFWEDILGYEGLYKISNKSRVKSLERFYGENNKIHKKDKIKSQHISFGYPHVTLSKGGIKKSYFIHRLIAIQFIPNPLNLPEVNHINGIRDDSRVENLEWVTCSENIKHAFRIGNKKIKRGVDSVLSKPILALKIDTQDCVIYASQREASRELNIKQVNIFNVLHGNLKTAKGYYFIFL